MTIRSVMAAFGSFGFVLVAIGTLTSGSRLVNRAPSSSASELVTTYKASEKNQIRVTQSAEQVVLFEKFDPATKAFVTTAHAQTKNGWSVEKVNDKTKVKSVTVYYIKDNKVFACVLDAAKKCVSGSIVSYTLSEQSLDGRAVSAYHQEYWQNQERAIALTYFKNVLISGEMELLDAKTLKLQHITLIVKELNSQSVVVKTKTQSWTLTKESAFTGTVIQNLAGAKPEDVYLTHGNFYGHDFISHIRVISPEHDQLVQKYVGQFSELNQWNEFFPASGFYAATPVNAFRDYKDLKVIHFLVGKTLTPVTFFSEILFSAGTPYEVTKNEAWRNLFFVNRGFTEFNLKHTLSNSANAYPSHFEAATQTIFWRTKDKVTGKEPILFKDQLSSEYPGILKDRLNKIVFNCRQHEVAPNEVMCRVENITGREHYGYATFSVEEDSGAPMKTILPKQKEYESTATSAATTLAGLMEWEDEWSHEDSYTYNKTGRLYQPAHGVKKLSECKGEYGEYDVALYLEGVFAKGWELKSVTSTSVVWYHDSDHVPPFLNDNYTVTYNRKKRDYVTRLSYSQRLRNQLQQQIDEINAYNQQVAEYNARIEQQNQNGYITRGGRRVGYVENGKVYSVSGIFATPNRLRGPVGTVDEAGNYSRRTLFGDMPTGYTLNNGTLDNGFVTGKP